MAVSIFMYLQANCAAICANISFLSLNTGLNESQQVDIWANKIGPYNSPTESYGYYDKMPWCRPESLERRSLKLGETLAGDFLVKSLYRLTFREPIANQDICEVSLVNEEVDQFIHAIRKRFVYDLLLDNLPMKLFVGELGDDDEPRKTYLYTHIEFTVSVNEGHVIEASATPGQPVELKDGERSTVRFSYSVNWQDVSELLLQLSGATITHSQVTLLNLLVRT